MLELTLRLIFSLAIVLGLLFGVVKISARRLGNTSGAPVRVLHRQSLSRASSVSVVAVGSRLLVLGTTDQQVQLLTELAPEDLAVPEAVLTEATQLIRPVGAHRAPRSPDPIDNSRPAPVGSPALAGSLVSPQTWRAARQAISRRSA